MASRSRLTFMCTRPTRHGAPIRYADGATLSVESHGDLVRLVTRNAAGAVVAGVEIAPTEAHQLGQSLVTASFATRDTSPVNS